MNVTVHIVRLTYDTNTCACSLSTIISSCRLFTSSYTLSLFSQCLSFKYDSMSSILSPTHIQFQPIPNPKCITCTCSLSSIISSCGLFISSYTLSLSSQCPPLKYDSMSSILSPTHIQFQPRTNPKLITCTCSLSTIISSCRLFTSSYTLSLFSQCLSFKYDSMSSILSPTHIQFQPIPNPKRITCTCSFEFNHFLLQTFHLPMNPVSFLLHNVHLWSMILWVLSPTNIQFQPIPNPKLITCTCSLSSIISSCRLFTSSCTLSLSSQCLSLKYDSMNSIPNSHSVSAHTQP